MMDIMQLVQLINSLSFVTSNCDDLELAIQCLDLTLLHDNVKEHEIDELVDNANNYHTAAICIPQTSIAHAKKRIKDCAIASVVNFPEGSNTLEAIRGELDYVHSQRAHEIDFVFPYQAYLSDNKKHALTALAEVKKFCESNKLVLKVIMETGEFDSLDTIYSTAKELVEFEPNFLKTSTGKTAHGASFEAVYAMSQAIKEAQKPIGIKVSGGVKTSLQALQYMHLVKTQFEGVSLNKDLFRIGASNLLHELANSLQQNKP